MAPIAAAGIQLAGEGSSRILGREGLHGSLMPVELPPMPLPVLGLAPPPLLTLLPCPRSCHALPVGCLALLPLLTLLPCPRSCMLLPVGCKALLPLLCSLAAPAGSAALPRTHCLGGRGRWRPAWVLR